MKKYLITFLAAAAIVPSLAFAQSYEVIDNHGLRQDRINLSSDRADLAQAQNALARDRALGNWWAITGDRMRVDQTRAQLDSDLDAYDSDRTVRTRIYRYYAPY